MCCRHTRAWRGPAYAALQPCLFDLKDPQQGAMTETGVNDVTLANAAAPKQHGVMPVPVIDMSLPEDVAAKQLRQACIDVGFFYRESLRSQDPNGRSFSVPHVCILLRSQRPL